MVRSHLFPQPSLYLYWTKRRVTGLTRFRRFLNRGKEFFYLSTEMIYLKNIFALCQHGFHKWPQHVFLSSAQGLLKFVPVLQEWFHQVSGQYPIINYHPSKCNPPAYGLASTRFCNSCRKAGSPSCHSWCSTAPSISIVVFPPVRPARVLHNRPGRSVVN